MIIQSNQNQSTYTEQVVASTVQGLHQCEKILGYEFQEAIYHLERLYALKAGVLDKPLTSEQLRNTNICPRHKVGLVIGEYGNPDSDQVCPECEREIKEQS